VTGDPLRFLPPDPATARHYASALDGRAQTVRDPKQCADELAEIVTSGDTPALGFYERHVEKVPRPLAGPDEWLRSDPERLRLIVFEMARFAPNDDERVANAAMSLGDELGIARSISARIVGYAIRDLRAQRQSVTR
jgi:hypothetical protein